MVNSSSAQQHSTSPNNINNNNNHNTINSKNATNTAPTTSTTSGSSLNFPSSTSIYNETNHLKPTTTTTTTTTTLHKKNSFENLNRSVDSSHRNSSINNNFIFGGNVAPPAVSAVPKNANNLSPVFNKAASRQFRSNSTSACAGTSSLSADQLLSLVPTFQPTHEYQRPKDLQKQPLAQQQQQQLYMLPTSADSSSTAHLLPNFYSWLIPGAMQLSGVDPSQGNALFPSLASTSNPSTAPAMTIRNPESSPAPTTTPTISTSAHNQIFSSPTPSTSSSGSSLVNNSPSSSSSTSPNLDSRRKSLASNLLQLNQSGTLTKRSEERLFREDSVSGTRRKKIRRLMNYCLLVN